MTRQQKFGWICIFFALWIGIGIGRYWPTPVGEPGERAIESNPPSEIDSEPDARSPSFPVIFEVETDRLVCGVIRGESDYGLGRTGESFGISCVPKIPGLFDKRIEQ